MLFWGRITMLLLSKLNIMKVQCVSIKRNIREVNCVNMPVKRKQTQGLHDNSGK